MPKLNVVISDILICKGFVRLCELYEMIIQRFDCLVFGWVRSDLIGMELQRESLVVGFNFFLGRRLFIVSYSVFKKPPQKFYLFDAQDIIWIPYLCDC